MDAVFEEDKIVKGSDLEVMWDIYQKAHSGKCSLKKESNGNCVYLVVDDSNYGDGLLRLCFTPLENAYVAFRRK
jgi:hypothetical protein